MTPQWQRAKFVKYRTDGHVPTGVPTAAMGATFWVYGPPRWQRALWLDGRGICAPALMFQTNVIMGKNSRGSLVHAEYIELLPEFAQDVPMISYEDFCRAND